jgi:hypothetical protein
MLTRMALHIRDFRDSDRAGLLGLCGRARRIGPPPIKDETFHILIGLRNDKPCGGIWLSLVGETGIVSAVAVDEAAVWRSDVRELIAEACLWLTSRGAARIELISPPEDEDLRTGLFDTQFRPDPATARLIRLVPARSPA